jgi:hypothetical protein
VTATEIEAIGEIDEAGVGVEVGVPSTKTLVDYELKSTKVAYRRDAVGGCPSSWLLPGHHYKFIVHTN